jgi:hypothetical protein
MPQWKRIAKAVPYLRKMREVFDAGFYLIKYPDVAATRVDPFRHYIEHGAAEGRKPLPLFDPEYYRMGFPGSKDLREPPLADFLRRTGDRCINPHPLFDCASYLQAHRDAVELNPLLHYVRSRRGAIQEGGGLAKIPFEAAQFSIMDVALTIVFVDEVRGRNAGLGGGVVLVWEDSSGRTQFIAPPEQRPFFEVMKYDQLRAQMKPPL